MDTRPWSPAEGLPAFPPADPTEIERIVRTGAPTLSAATAVTLFEPVRPGRLERPKKTPKSYNPEEEFRRAFWEGLERERRMLMAETLPHRTRIGWRIVREMCRLKNIVSENELLVEALPIEPDPWVEACPFNKPPNANDLADQKRYMVPLWDVVERICKNYNSPDMPGQAGLPLLPPAVPEEHLSSDGEVSEEYTPHEDTRLRSYLKAAERIVDHYSMEWRRNKAGAPEEDPDGRAGAQPLLDPTICRVAWPTRAQIVYYETMIVEETISQCEFGRKSASEYLSESYGLSEREIKSLISIAMTELRARQDTDIEEKRALMVHRLESFMDRSRNALDLNNEMKAMKVLAVVEGLTRTEPEDANQSFLETTERLSRSSGPGIGSGTPQLDVIDVPNNEE